MARPIVDANGDIVDDGSNYPTTSFPGMHTQACPFRNAVPAPANAWYMTTYADATRSAAKLTIVVYCRNCGNNRTVNI